jgi:hypothetical protein
MLGDSNVAGLKQPAQGSEFVKNLRYEQELAAT